jgi:hypothetical protein
MGLELTPHTVCIPSSYASVLPSQILLPCRDKLFPTSSSSSASHQSTVPPSPFHHSTPNLMRLARSISDAQNQQSLDHLVPASPTLAKLLAAATETSSSSATSNGDVFVVPTSRGPVSTVVAGQGTAMESVPATGRPFRRTDSVATSRHLFKAKQVAMTRKGAQQPLKPASVSSARATTAKRKAQSPKRKPPLFRLPPRLLDVFVRPYSCFILCFQGCRG